MEENTIAELKAAHGDDLTLLAADDFEVVVKRPSRTQFARFRASILEPASRAQAGANLLRDVVVYPPWPEFMKIVERFPALEDEFMGQVVELTKTQERVSAKKL